MLVEPKAEGRERSKIHIMTQNKHRSPLAVLSDDQLCPSHSGSQATEQFERYYTQHIGSHLEDVANRSDWSSLLGDLDHCEVVAVRFGNMTDHEGSVDQCLDASSRPNVRISSTSTEAYP